MEGYVYLATNKCGAPYFRTTVRATLEAAVTLDKPFLLGDNWKLHRISEVPEKPGP